MRNLKIFPFFDKSLTETEHLCYNQCVITHTPTPSPSPVAGEGKMIEKTGYAGCVSPAYPVFSTLISPSLKEKCAY